MFGLLSSDFGLLLYWVMGFDLCQRRDGIFAGARDVMGSISILCNFFFFFFLIENLWACRERATCNGLAVGFACRGLRLDRLVLFLFCFVFFFFFQILVKIFFGFFFFFFGLESRTDYR